MSTTWNNDWQTWMHNNEEVGLAPRGSPNTNYFFGPVSQYGNEDSKYIFLAKETDYLGTPHLMGHFNEEGESLYTILIKSLNESDMTLESYMPGVEIFVQNGNKFTINHLEWKDHPEWSNGRTLAVYIFGPVLTIILITLFRKQIGKPVDNFRLHPSDVPMEGLSWHPAYAEEYYKNRP